MQEIIGKTAKDINKYNNKIIYYKNARSGFSEILKYIKSIYEDFTLLVPAFIGYSPREGSGIYDPIVENNIKHRFYPIDEHINILLDEYKKNIESIEGKIVVLLVHYFGYVDKNIENLVVFAKKNDVIIIEDCAHALYTDYIDNKCGMYSDASLYSLHKMLPYSDGGMVRINNNIIKLKETNNFYNLLEYDIRKIAEKRKKNAQILETELKKEKEIEILRPIDMYKNQTPQTYPILIKSKDKNELYHKLNEKGFGVVSLYHTMIEELRNEKYDISNKVSKRILNLPVHQDAEEKDLINMCKLLKTLLGE